MPTDQPYESSMFPLGMPSLPGMVLNLRVFEPRYRELAARVTSGAEPLATVMIDRGSEVGGRDERSDVGCSLLVTDFRDAHDGTWEMAVVARQRIRVVRWLTDDPYPRALIENWPDDPDNVTDTSEASWRLASALASGELDRQRVLLAASMGERLDVLLEMAMEQRSLLDLMSRHGGGSSR